MAEKTKSAKTRQRKPKGPFSDELLDQLHAQVRGRDAESLLGESGLIGHQSSGFAINNRGEVVGNSRAVNGQDHAFVYVPGSGIIDLNDLIPPNSGWDLTVAADINGLGKIVGYGYALGGDVHAFLLSPVPEPATWLLLLCGLLLVPVARRPPHCRRERF